MFDVLQVLTVILVVVALVPALAHALEWPGKMRLTKEAYVAVQPIYYPGFTIAGGTGGGWLALHDHPLGPDAAGECGLLADARGPPRAHRDAGRILARDAPGEYSSGCRANTLAA